MWAIRSFAGYELIEMAQFWFVAVGLLVGVAPGAVRLLHVVPPSAFASLAGAGQETPAARTPATVAGIDFRAILRRNLGLSR